MQITNIAVVGVGGVGGFFGGKLCSAISSGRHVSFVARGEHLRAIREHGLVVNSEADGDQVHRPSLITADFDELPPLDLCLLCVKEYDLAAVLRGLAKRIGATTLVLPLLNGMDVPSRIRRVVPQGILLPACVYVGTHLERPGRVVQKGGAGRILFGPDPDHPGFLPGELLRLFESCGIEAEFTPRITSEIWQKFIFICAFGLVSAAHHRTLGEILDNPNLRAAVDLVMREAAMLAEASGVSLPEDIISRCFAKARTFPHDARTSFQRDFARRDRRDERELFGGALLALGERLGRSASGTRDLCELLEREKPGPEGTRLPVRPTPPFVPHPSMRVSDR